MRMSQRAPKILKLWAILGLQLLVLHVLLIGGWIIIDPHIRANPSLMIMLVVAYLAAFGVIAFWFTRRIIAASEPPEIAETLEHGIPATAKVLDIQRTRWRRERTRNFRLQVSPTRFEYVMRVRVSPPEGDDYEAEVAEFLSGEEIPKKGDKMKVRIHPEQPELVVMVGKHKIE